MGDNLLSICIATYNRAHLIGETLESILPQATDETEVLVVDGASPDNTEEVVRSYQKRYGQLRYVRLPEKGGVDQDYDRAVEMASGEYCWLFSDDDTLKAGAVEAVLGAVRRKYSLVLVNAEIRTVDLSELLAERKLRITSDRVYEDNRIDRERLFAETCDYLTFIGGVVIRRDIWLSRNRSRYYGSRFIHVGVIFQDHLPGKVVALSHPWISIRLGNAEWSGRSFEIWMFKWPELIWSFSNYSEAARRAVCRMDPWRRVPGLIYSRALGVYSIADYRTFLDSRLSSLWARATARAIAAMPGRLANACMFLYGSLKGDRLLMFYLRHSNFGFGGKGNID